MRSLIAPGDTAAAIPVYLVAPGNLDSALSTLPEPLPAFARASGFSAKEGKAALLPSPGGALAAVLFGLGEPARRPPLLAGRLP
jgi:leucyl aminopeptidase